MMHGRVRDLLELVKFRLSSLVVVTTAIGFWLGLVGPARLWALLPTCLGTALVVWGANALNQWMEREPDALMDRTRNRPLPAGRMSPTTALAIGFVLTIAGVAWLGWAVNGLSAVLAAFSWLSYVVVYTPLKRRTPLCTLVGAIPGAMPPLIGWAGAHGSLSTEAWPLFAILFLWQLPHFLALAVLYCDDYARARFPILPLIEPDGMLAARQTVLYGLTLLPVSLVPTMIGVAGAAYFYGALLLSVIFLGVALHAAWRRSRASAQRLFQASIVYLPILLALLAADRALL